MLAYVFWHQPAAGVATTEYEAHLAAFHATIGVVCRPRAAVDPGRRRPYGAVEAALPGRAAWQRQMTLGPTPEDVLHSDAGPLEGDPAVAYTFSAT